MKQIFKLLSTLFRIKPQKTTTKPTPKKKAPNPYDELPKGDDALMELFNSTTDKPLRKKIPPKLKNANLRRKIYNDPQISDYVKGSLGENCSDIDIVKDIIENNTSWCNRAAAVNNPHLKEEDEFLFSRLGKEPHREVIRAICNKISDPEILQKMAKMGEIPSNFDAHRATEYYSEWVDEPEVDAGEVAKNKLIELKLWQEDTEKAATA